MSTAAQEQRADQRHVAQGQKRRLAKIEERHRPPHARRRARLLRVANEQHRVAKRIRPREQDREADRGQEMRRREQHAVTANAANPPERREHPERRDVQGTPQQGLSRKARSAFEPTSIGLASGRRAGGRQARHSRFREARRRWAVRLRAPALAAGERQRSPRPRPGDSAGALERPRRMHGSRGAALVDRVEIATAARLRRSTLCVASSADRPPYARPMARMATSDVAASTACSSSEAPDVLDGPRGRRGRSRVT